MSKFNFNFVKYFKGLDKSLFWKKSYILNLVEYCLKTFYKF